MRDSESQPAVMRLEVLGDRGGLEACLLGHCRQGDGVSEGHANRAPVLPSAESSQDGISRQQAEDPGDGSPDPVRHEIGAVIRRVDLSKVGDQQTDSPTPLTGLLPWPRPPPCGSLNLRLRGRSQARRRVRR